MELEEKEHQQRRLTRRRSVSPYALEAGRGPRKSRSSNHRLPSPESVSSSSSRDGSPSRGASLSKMMIGVNNLFSLLLSPAWVQTFVMTFLGEWGDRSQIATIAMAAGQDYWWVTCGAIMGHGICTAAAVIGGRAIAGKVSMRVGKYHIIPLKIIIITRKKLMVCRFVKQLHLAALSHFSFSASYICSKLFINLNRPGARFTLSAPRHTQLYSSSFPLTTHLTPQNFKRPYCINMNAAASPVSWRPGTITVYFLYFPACLHKHISFLLPLCHYNTTGCLSRPA